MSEILGANGLPAGDNNAGGAAGDGDLIKDATIETFESDVLAASMTVPVIVDFWADWCQPCKQLGPVLERAVIAAGGKVQLVKIDIDKNQMLASQLRIQSIPTVYAFFQGRPVDGFQGAVPESEIKEFIERLTQAAGAAGTGQPNNQEQDYVAIGEAALEGGDVAAAAQLFAQGVQADPENLAAIAGLARCHLALGDKEQARQTLAMAPEDKHKDPALSGVVAALSLAEDNQDGDVGELQARLQSNPDDLDLRFELAGAQLGAGAMEEAMEQLLAIIERDREWNEEAARKKLLTVFEALGQGHPATLRGRRKLSSILFS
jgi:putative thioredoxin